MKQQPPDNAAELRLFLAIVAGAYVITFIVLSLNGGTFINNALLAALLTLLWPTTWFGIAGVIQWLRGK